MSLSPDATTVVSGAADETIRLWKCWEVDESAKKKKKVSVSDCAGGSSKPKSSMQARRGLR